MFTCILNAKEIFLFIISVFHIDVLWVKDEMSSVRGISTLEISIPMATPSGVILKA
jgi:hypothetical protein